MTLRHQPRLCHLRDGAEARPAVVLLALDRHFLLEEILVYATAVALHGRSSPSIVEIVGSAAVCPRSPRAFSLNGGVRGGRREGVRDRVGCCGGGSWCRGASG